MATGFQRATSAPVTPRVGSKTPSAKSALQKSDDGEPGKFLRFVKKVKMGKKVEKNLKDKGHSSASQDHEDGDKTPEPHICTGNFYTDFQELCRRNNMVVIPPIVPRPHRPPSPAPEPASKPEKKGKEKQQQPEPEPEPELGENGEPVEPPPKTYTTKDKFEYFKPCVQVEADNPDKGDTVTEVVVRGWKIDEPMMNVFKQCMVTMDKLTTINFWNAGLTGETVSLMASFFPNCANLKNLILDGNPVKEENWHVLIGEESLIQNISLRYNSITDKGVELLAKALGTTTKANTKLLSLNLNGNVITDVGAAHLAKGLRMNRNLLSLSLVHNQIGDTGAKAFAEVLSRFPLTHEEVVERRKLISEKGSPDRGKSPPPSRRADSKDRPGSVRSSSHVDKDKKRDKSSKKKDGKGTEKDDKKKKDDKTLSKKGGGGGTGRSSGASVVADAGKATTKGKDKKGKDKKGAVQQELEPETPEFLNPLLEPVESINHELWVPGNRILINLNLSRNQIGDEGMKAFLQALQYQTTLSKLMSGTGLMRILLNKNKVSPKNELLEKISQLMLTKDPFYKPPPSPENESQVA